MLLIDIWPTTNNIFNSATLSKLVPIPLGLIDFMISNMIVERLQQPK